jgi:hypothetical protein
MIMTGRSGKVSAFETRARSKRFVAISGLNRDDETPAITKTF